MCIIIILVSAVSWRQRETEERCELKQLVYYK